MVTNSRPLASLSSNCLSSTPLLFAYSYLRYYQAQDPHSGQTLLLSEFIRTTEEQLIQRSKKHGLGFFSPVMLPVPIPGYQFSITIVSLHCWSYLQAETPVEYQGIVKQAIFNTRLQLHDTTVCNSSKIWGCSPVQPERVKAAVHFSDLLTFI